MQTFDKFDKMGWVKADLMYMLAMHDIVVLTVVGCRVGMRVGRPVGSGVGRTVGDRVGRAVTPVV